MTTARIKPQNKAAGPTPRLDFDANGVPTITAVPVTPSPPANPGS